MINAIELFQINAHLHPEKMAIADIKFGSLSFSDIEIISARVQALAHNYKLTQNDSVLVALTPSPLLYGVICGLMGLGIRIVFIEPWLGLDRIKHVIEITKPRMFLCGVLGKIWGLRSSAIRSIPYWISPGEVMNMHDQKPFKVKPLGKDHHAFIVFSSGTTGAPKGVIRSHQYMQNIFDVFTTLEPQNFSGPDLIIFPNVALFHLATGRGSVIVPHSWSRQKLTRTFELCEKYQPTTISTGPAFLKKLMDLEMLGQLANMKRIVVGGALTDCWILEELFKKLPLCKFMHLYGGSEAEPVAMIDAKIAVANSRARGFFQTLCLGKIIPQLNHQIKEEILWVSGPNVAGEYIGPAQENSGIKERDNKGQLWHCMGDRVELINEELWIKGRQNQEKADFILEQKIYSTLNSSKSFICRNKKGERILLGENLRSFEEMIKMNFPEINSIHETKIIRDKRHRSRINRKDSLPRLLRNK